MSTNKLSHLTEWDKIYLEVTRELSNSDDSDGLIFRLGSNYATFVDDNDTFYTLEELKQLANDGMPKQGDDVQVKYTDDEWKRSEWIDAKFIAFYKSNIVTQTEDWLMWTVFWRLKPKKTELTLAEVEEKLGIEKGSLTIKD